MLSKINTRLRYWLLLWQMAQSDLSRSLRQASYRPFFFKYGVTLLVVTSSCLSEIYPITYFSLFKNIFGKLNLLAIFVLLQYNRPTADLLLRINFSIEL